MKVYKASGIKWDCDNDAQSEWKRPTTAYVKAENEDGVIDALSDEFMFCVESVEEITESTMEDAIEYMTICLLKESNKVSKDKIKKALSCGAVNVADYELDYELPKIILHAVMKSMADETMPLYHANRKESNNLYKFI